MIRFTLSKPTPSLNRGSGASGNWRAILGVKRKMQRAWAWDIWAQLPSPIPYYAKAHVKITRCSAGTLDIDNLYGGVKGLIDVLKPPGKSNPFGLGLIAGDEPDKLTLVVEQVKVKRAEARTVIEITEQ